VLSSAALDAILPTLDEASDASEGDSHPKPFPASREREHETAFEPRPLFSIKPIAPQAGNAFKPKASERDASHDGNLSPDQDVAPDHANPFAVESDAAGVALALAAGSPLIAAHVPAHAEADDATDVERVEPDNHFATAQPASARTGAWWTIPLMCAGIAIVACAVLVPAADDNRRAVHELARIERDVAYFERQSEVNKQFLEHVSTDPTLAERLALRQLRLTRAASAVVPLSRQADPFGMSPYALVTIDPPPAIADYRPVGGFLSKYFLNARTQVYLAGLGLLLTAAGVILGGGSRQPAHPDPENGVV
jgi:hypothetical protein